MEKKSILVVSLYVDDLIYIGNDDKLMMEFKMSMKLEFGMTDMGKMKFFLGLEATQKANGIFFVSKEVHGRPSTEIWNGQLKISS